MEINELCTAIACYIILKASCILQYFVQYLHRHHCHGICRIKNSENRRIRIKLLIEYAKKLILKLHMTITVSQKQYIMVN